MAWLTVSKAAERLEISEAAVRKRIQRGTLANRREPDGRVSVYIDQNNGKVKFKGSEEDTQRSWDFAQVSTLLAVVASATYALGLLSIWIPLATIYTKDLTVAWYMATLVPRAVVVGQGTSQLLLPPIILWLALAAWEAACDYVIWMLRGKGEETSLRAHAIAVLIGTILIPLLWAAAFYIPVFTFLEKMPQVSYGQGAIAAGFYVLGFAIIFLVLFLRESFLREGKAPASERRFDFSEFANSENFKAAFKSEVKRIYVENSGRTLTAAAVMLVGAFFLALGFIVAFKEPPLPTVEITKDKGATDNNNPSPIHGALLVHTERVWHVLEDQGELTAIPDEDVKTVRVSTAAHFDKRRVEGH